MDSVALWIGAVACTAAAAAGLLPLPRRVRLAGLTLAVLIAPLLVVADSWDTERLVEIRDTPFTAGAVVSFGVFAICLLALILRRRPLLLAPLLVATMPFRIPVDLGGGSVNLLLPLYAVVGAGLLAAWIAPNPEPPEEGPALTARWLMRFTGVALAAVVFLYGLQSGYADDISPAIRNVAFFLAPFAALYFLLTTVEWDRRALTAIGIVLAVEGLLFALVAGFQCVTGELFWNDKLIEGNEAHAYFRVNSLFFDPNILGRYLALTMVALAALVAFGRERRQLIAAGVLFVVLLITLVVTYSQSSMIALIAGMLVLTALRFGIATGLAAGVAAAVTVAVSVALIAGGSVSEDTSGRSGLIDGGLEIAGDAPFLGAGSGSFPAEFKERFGGGAGVAVESHTEPVTVLAEGGALGFVAYLGLLVVTIVGLIVAAGPALRERARGTPLAAALLATYAVMLVHSLGYAAFLTDPITWALLAVGATALVPAALRALEEPVEPAPQAA